MKIFLAGNWLNKPKKLEVKNPFDNSMVDPCRELMPAI
jgi:hypothetical protein